MVNQFIGTCNIYVSLDLSMVTWNVLLCCLDLNDLRINIWGSHWLLIKCWQLVSTLSWPSQGFYTQLEFIPKLELISTWEKDDTDIPVDNFRSIRLNKTAVRFSTEYFLWSLPCDIFRSDVKLNKLLKNSWVAADVWQQYVDRMLL